MQGKNRAAEKFDVVFLKQSRNYNSSIEISAVLDILTVHDFLVLEKIWIPIHVQGMVILQHTGYTARAMVRRECNEIEIYIAQLILQLEIGSYCIQCNRNCALQ